MNDQRTPQERRPVAHGGHRFQAEWVERQHLDADGEWNPDRYEYAVSQHATKDEAESAAIRESKRSGVEWILVAEQEYKGRHTWVDVSRWTGDWDGLHDKTL